MSGVAINPHLGPKDEVIAQYLRLVHYMAKRFSNFARQWRIDYEDLYGAGCVGLVKAYNMYVPDRGAEFITYAGHMIQNEIRKYLRGADILKIGRTTVELRSKAVRMGVQWLTPEEMAGRLGCSFELATRVRDSLKAHTQSLDEEVFGGNRRAVTLGDTLSGEDPSFSMVEFMASLTEREKHLVTLRLNGLTQKQAGKEIGVSQMQVSRLLHKIGVKLQA